MPSNEKLLILAAGLQVLLTFVVMMRMAAARFAALKGREVRLSEVALDMRNYPERMHKLQNNLVNQFETPVMFYAVIAVALAAGLESMSLVLLAYLWLASRAVHMAIHTGSNNVMRRFRAFVVGLVVLVLMWVVVVVGAFLG